MISKELCDGREIVFDHETKQSRTRADEEEIRAHGMIQTTMNIDMDITQHDDEMITNLI